MLHSLRLKLIKGLGAGVARWFTNSGTTANGEASDQWLFVLNLGVDGTFCKGDSGTKATYAALIVNSLL